MTTREATSLLSRSGDSHLIGDYARSLSDRLAVMSGGRIEQAGTPEEIYESPASSFVADFVGGTNLLRGTIVGTGAGGIDRVAVAGGGTIAVRPDPDRQSGADVLLMIKPERVSISGSDLSGDGLSGEVASVASRYQPKRAPRHRPVALRAWQIANTASGPAPSTRATSQTR